MNAPPSHEPAPVRIVDIQMPFGSMVVFMVKWAIAAIPALIILAVIGVFAAGILSGMIIGGTRHSPYSYEPAAGHQSAKSSAEADAFYDCMKRYNWADSAEATCQREAQKAEPN